MKKKEFSTKPALKGQLAHIFLFFDEDNCERAVQFLNSTEIAEIRFAKIFPGRKDHDGVEIECYGGEREGFVPEFLEAMKPQK